MQSSRLAYEIDRGPISPPTIQSPNVSFRVESLLADMKGGAGIDKGGLESLYI